MIGDRSFNSLSQTQLHLSQRARRDSNPRPTALETVALPTELHALISLLDLKKSKRVSLGTYPCIFRTSYNYLMISETVPAPIVRPPSRIAKRIPTSIAIGAISFTEISTLSPGITISTPSGNSIVPVTSVVRK